MDPAIIAHLGRTIRNVPLMPVKPTFVIPCINDDPDERFVEDGLNELLSSSYLFELTDEEVDDDEKYGPVPTHVAAKERERAELMRRRDDARRQQLLAMYEDEHEFPWLQPLIANNEVQLQVEAEGVVIRMADQPFQNGANAANPAAGDI